MDDFIEFILELLLEGSIDALPNKKIPLVIRIILAIILALVLIGIIILGVLLFRDSTFIGCLVIALGVIFLIVLIVKMIEHIKY